MRASPVKNMVFTAVCCALCVVLPVAFHSVQNAGSVFLPMHIPVLLCGLVCGWPYGLTCGFLGPLLSSLVTQMPPLGMAPAMMIECGLYGGVAGLLMQLIRSKNTVVDLYICMILSMIVGRVLAGITRALIFTPGLDPIGWVVSSVITGIPGICIQLVLIPLLYMTLVRAKLIPRKY